MEPIDLREALVMCYREQKGIVKQMWRLRIKCLDELISQKLDSEERIAELESSVARCSKIPIGLADFERLLVRHHIIHEDAIDDPDGYDADATIENVLCLYEDLFPAPAPAKNQSGQCKDCGITVRSLHDGRCVTCIKKAYAGTAPATPEEYACECNQEATVREAQGRNNIT